MVTFANVPAGETFIHLSEIGQRPRWLRAWEHTRHRNAHWLVECVAEATGVFLYCYAGGGAQAAFIIGNLTSSEGAGCKSHEVVSHIIEIVVAERTRSFVDRWPWIRDGHCLRACLRERDVWWSLQPLYHDRPGRAEGLPRQEGPDVRSRGRN